MVKTKSTKVKDKDPEESSERDQYTVVLEDLRSNFKVFGESLSFIRDDIKAVKGDVKVLKTDVSTLKTDVSTLKTDVIVIKGDLKNFKDETRSNFKTVFNYLSNIDEELVAVKRIPILEVRVDQFERELAKR